MTDEYKPVARLAELPRESFSQGVQYQSLDAELSDRLRLRELGAVYTEVPPGKSACPFHVHHGEDEMFVILEGQGSYRFGEENYKVAAGDVLGAPRGGAEYAHKLVNTGEVPLRYLAISSRAMIDVCEYPDSGKFAVMSRAERFEETRFRYIGRMESALDYWDGEAGA
jgi:uncharacterized cupin superfamily protein